MGSGTARAVGCLVVAAVVLTAAVLGVFSWLRGRGLTAPLPGQERCVATVGESSVALDLDQAHYASIIVGLSVRRGLPPRAASIAMATVYQETGIRNLDYGDRDSVGLFQQRPSQGWGTEEQLQDPYYATNRFYDALVRIDGWEQGDITEIAQRIQRSGYPDAYRDHEADARVLASSLTGQSAASFTCLDRSGTTGKPAGLVRSMRRTLGSTRATITDQVILVRASDAAMAWAYAHYAVANTQAFGVTGVEVAGRQWRADPDNLPQWVAATPGTDTGSGVRITLR